MLQFIDQIKSKKGFVDLHIHTNDSYGEEMDKMDLTPEELLESIYQYSVKNNNAPVTFAITDHNSIDAVQKIDILIKSNPEKYKHIRFISGCEFSCSAGSLGTYTNDEGHVKNIVKNFHMLAYGFNPTDEDLQFLTKLHSTRKDNSIYCEKVEYLEKIKIKIPAGTYVLAIKNIMKDYGFDYPIKKFKDVNLKTRNIDEHTYINYLMNYIQKFNLPENVTRDIRRQLVSRNIIHLGRLDVMEIMETVEKAGGYCVLAHPKLLDMSTGVTTNILKNNPYGQKILANIDGKKHYKKHSLIKYVAESLKYRAFTKDGKKLRGIVGIETLHSSCSYNKNLETDLIEIASDNKLYITGGSDSHGSLLKDNILSLCFPTSFLNNKQINNITLNKNLFADLIYNKQLESQIDCNKEFKDQILLTIEEEDCETIINSDLDLIDFISSKHKKDYASTIVKTPKKQNQKQERHLKALKKVRELERNCRNLITTFIKTNKNLEEILNNTTQPKYEVLTRYNAIKKDLKFKQKEFKIITENYDIVKKYSATKYLNQLIETCKTMLNKLSEKYNFNRDDYLKFIKFNEENEIK